MISVYLCTKVSGFWRGPLTKYILSRKQDLEFPTYLTLYVSYMHFPYLLSCPVISVLCMLLH